MAFRVKPSIEHNTIAPRCDKSQAMFDVFECMFDVIVNEVRKYSPNARKFEAKAEKQFEWLDVIAIVQVKTKPHAVKHAARFNLQR